MMSKSLTNNINLEVECFQSLCKKNYNHEEQLTKRECINHLDNWEEWKKKRIQLYHRFHRRLGRTPGNLVMNYGDEFVKIQRERVLLEHAKINTNFDKYRENPEFWRLPDKLGRENCEYGPQYFAVKTNAERNFIPPVEHVAKPQLILEEKHSYPLLRNMYTKWSSSKYRNQQLKNLKSKIEVMEPHIPDPSSLFIIGKSFLPHSEKTIKEETVQTSVESLEGVFSSYFEFHKIERLSLNVNDKKLLSMDSLPVTSPKIKYFFHHSDLKTPIRETLALENKGLSTVKVVWKKLKKYYMFKENLQNVIEPESCFYFGKQEILVRPGKTAEIPLWFLPKKHGVYMEKWTIHTTPKIADDQCELIIIFQCATEDDEYEKTLARIEEFIESGVRKTMIRDCLTDLIGDFRYGETGSNMFSISENQLFECRNLKETLGLRKSIYAYNKSTLKDLRLFYGQIKQGNECIFENLSVEELKWLARKADIMSYIKGLLKLFETTNKIREELEQNQKLPNGKSKVDAVSNASIKDMLTGSQEVTNVEKLKSILLRFEAPLMIPNYDREKYAIVFLIMRSYFIKMCDTLEPADPLLENDYLPGLSIKIVSNNLPERWKKETFDDVWLPRTKHNLSGTHPFPVAPKPKSLEALPKDNVEGIYEIYFKAKVDKTTTFKSYVSSEGAPDHQFDTFILNKEDNTTDKSNTVEYPTDGEEYDYATYILIYTTLQNFINAMTAILETLKDTHISEDILERVFTSEKEEYLKKNSLTLKSIDEKEQDKTYFEHLLNLILLDNENVREYILNDKIPNEIENSTTEYS